MGSRRRRLPHLQIVPPRVCGIPAILIVLYVLVIPPTPASSMPIDVGEAHHIHTNISIPSLPFNDDNKDHNEDSDEKLHALGVDQTVENMINKLKQALANGEGCRVYGVLDVQMVAGNFHVAPQVLHCSVGNKIKNHGNTRLLCAGLPIYRPDVCLIIELHAKVGNKWVQMAAELHCSIDNKIKNHGNTRLLCADLPIYPPDVCLIIELHAKLYSIDEHATHNVMTLWKLLASMAPNPTQSLLEAERLTAEKRSIIAIAICCLIGGVVKYFSTYAIPYVGYLGHTKHFLPYLRARYHIIGGPTSDPAKRRDVLRAMEFVNPPVAVEDPDGFGLASPRCKPQSLLTFKTADSNLPLDKLTYKSIIIRNSVYACKQPIL